MKKYNEKDFSGPEVYQQDEEVLEVALRLAKKRVSYHPNYSGVYQEILDGQYPHYMLAMWERHLSQPAYFAEMDLKAEETAEILKNFKIPQGFGLTIMDDVEGIPSIAFKSYTIGLLSELFVSKIKDIGGRYETNPRFHIWLIPLSKVKELISAFEDAQEEVDRLTLEKAKDLPSRVRVRVGEFKVGDEIDGAKIKSFGKIFQAYDMETAAELFPEGYMQLWEPCRCGVEPVYSPKFSIPSTRGDHKCLKCWNKILGTGEKVDVCYAYFDH